MSKTSKLRAFKGRSRGRRKREAVEAARDAALDGVAEIVRHGVRRFPRTK